MKTIEFGKVSKVNLRDIWLKEEHHFTPWLCENLDKLGEAIGIDIELKQREASVGKFELDILAQDISRDRVVVIENQIEPTDHKHLGQLITYASFFKAGVIIWISETIQEQHRAAIDWLNEITSDEIEFFAVEIEVFKIEDSKPALNFKLKAFPNEWQKTTKWGNPNVSDKMEAYRFFFQQLIDELRTKHRFTNAKAGQPQSWYSFSSGISGILYGISFAKGNKVRAELYIDTGDYESNKNIFNKLKVFEKEIHDAFNAPLEWEFMENKRASRIAIYRDGSIDSDKETLNTIRNWSIENILKIKSTFEKRLKKIVNS
jgi:hypothetical protein